MMGFYWLKIFRIMERFLGLNCIQTDSQCQTLKAQLGTQQRRPPQPEQKCLNL